MNEEDFYPRIHGIKTLDDLFKVEFRYNSSDEPVPETHWQEIALLAREAKIKSKWRKRLLKVARRGETCFRVQAISKQNIRILLSMGISHVLLNEKRNDYAEGIVVL